MIKINEKFTLTSGFFTSLKANNPTQYAEYFGEIEASDLEIDFLSMCGERYAAPVVTYSESMDTLTRVILNHYKDSWDKVKAALFAAYDITKPYNMKTTVTSEKGVNANGTTQNTRESGVYGFDSVAAVNDEKETTNGTSTDKSTETLTQTTENTGNIGNTNFSQLVQAEIETRKITFLTLVMNDIKEFVTLKIY